MAELEASQAPEGAPESPKAVLREVILVYLVTLLAIRGVVSVQRSAGLPPDVLILVPLLFIYAPRLWLKRIDRRPDDYGMELYDLKGALWFNLKMGLAVFPAFILLNHLYQGVVFDRSPGAILPSNLLLNVVLYHLLYAALPEEIFYRGYVQTRLNEVMAKKWRLFGVSFGWSLPLTALLFTVGHSIVEPRWWHFAIFIPGLLFGWIRERSSNVLPSTFFHALCNITMVLLDTAYGVIPP